ncbi:MAG: cbb3-type cytochrome oxidase assembly protein CcoS [Flavobacteriia bacterium]|nr:cbb3-type cytochrome oxidase assembly protein CcoS [Flavobacteriia bacterium]
MGVIYLLLTISVVVALGFFAAFLGAVHQGQFDDPYSPAVRMLFEDELVKTPSKQTNNKPSHPTENKLHS